VIGVDGEPPPPAIRLRGVAVEFRGGGHAVTALGGIDLDVRAGELLCLLGPSGCGKSTLLDVVAGFTRPTAGAVEALGRTVERPGPDRAMVFQEYALFPWMTVERNVAFGLEVARAAPSRVRRTVDGLLARLGLSDFRDRFPRELSGGMRQRVAIARALAIDPPMLLMDEPFGALDALTRRVLQDELLRLWAEDRKTILFVTHSIEESLHLADRVVVMTYRPGTVKRVVEVPLPRPRDPYAPEFSRLARELTGLVMTEEARHQADEGSTAR
jgi:NitT/TauT family transport system ATP-binding protein